MEPTNCLQEQVRKVTLGPGDSRTPFESWEHSHMVHEALPAMQSSHSPAQVLETHSLEHPGSGWRMSTIGPSYMGPQTLHPDKMHK